MTSTKFYLGVVERKTLWEVVGEEQEYQERRWYGLYPETRTLTTE